MKNWGLQHLEIKSDPQLEVGKHLLKKGLPAPMMEDPPPFNRTWKTGESFVQSAGYATGMYQPAILVFTEESKLLFEYIVIPEARNLGGAAPKRPKAAEVLEAIKSPKADGTPYRPDTVLLPAAAPYILLMLTFARGNFLMPISALLEDDGVTPAPMKAPLVKVLAVLGGLVWLGIKKPLAAASIVGGYGSFVYFLWGTWVKDFLWNHPDNARQAERRSSAKRHI